MTASTLTFAEFQPEHLPGALRLTQQVKWPHRAEDWAFFLRLSSGVVALDGSEIVGTTLVTRFGPVAVMSMIVVDARLRGRGLGRSLMERAMSGLDAPEVRLVATEDGRPLYEKLGFESTGSVAQYQGEVILPGAMAATEAGGAEWLSPADAAEMLPALAELDRIATGADRTTLLEALADVGRLAVLRREGVPVAWAALRSFGRGEVLGPIIAPDLPAAEALLSLVASECRGRFLRVDTGVGSGLGEGLSALGLKLVGGGLKMRRGSASAVSRPQSHHAFALTAQALG